MDYLIVMSTLTVCLLLSSLIPGLKLQPITTQKIPEVHFNLLITRSPPGFTVNWDPLNVTTGAAPVIGIKVKAWKLLCVIKTVYQIAENGTRKKIVKYEVPTYLGTTVPDAAPEHVAIVKADELSATVPNIDQEQWYIVRALVFTKSAEGPLSESSYLFKLGDQVGEVNREGACEKVISETVCKSEFLDRDCETDEYEY